MRIFLIVLSFLSLNSFGQRNLRDSTINTMIVGLNYKFNLTSGDLANLWGYNHEIGISYDNKFKNNFTLGMSSGFIFGNQLKDSTIFAPLVNDFGHITNLGGGQAEILFVMRGMTANINAGFIFKRFGNNPNSGLWIQGGLGFLMHKIRIES